MKKTEWNEGLNHLDPALVEDYIAQKEKLTRQKKHAGLWLRVAAAAACFALLVGGIIALQKDALPNSAVISGGKITGKQELIYGNPGADDTSDALILAPGFYINTVIQADVIEVLPDTFYVPGNQLPGHVARLSVVDLIRGEGLPREIFLWFPHYDTDIFDGYDTFIFSLGQCGIENYMMINETKGEVTYFPHMFHTVSVSDLGYGSVIAFTDGKVDARFWDKAAYLNIGGYIDSMLSDPAGYRYPVGRDSTLKEAKANIVQLAQNTESIYVGDLPGDYITAADIFVSQEGKQVKAYLEPSQTNVFMQEIYIDEDRIVATYKRVINGFLTDEVIIINDPTGAQGAVVRQGAGYRSDELAKVPDLGEVLQNMDLSQLKPPHMEVGEGMRFQYALATGVYRKVEGALYGIIRVMWYYTDPGIKNGYAVDDLYYLYAEDGSCEILERDALRALLGDDPIIAWYAG